MSNPNQSDFMKIKLMMLQNIFVALVVSLIFTINAKALSSVVTIANNDIVANTLWSGDTVKVLKNISILQNATLTIAPKTFVKFMGNYSINCSWGKLIAVGSGADSIRFSVNDTTGFAKNPATTNGGWGGINLSEGSHIEKCVFSYIKTSSQGIKLVKNACVKGNRFFKNSTGAGLFVAFTDNCILLNNKFQSNNDYIVDINNNTGYYSSVFFSNMNQIRI